MWPCLTQVAGDGVERLHGLAQHLSRLVGQVAVGGAVEAVPDQAVQGRCGGSTPSLIRDVRGGFARPRDLPVM